MWHVHSGMHNKSSKNLDAIIQNIVVVVGPIVRATSDTPCHPHQVPPLFACDGVEFGSSLLSVSNLDAEEESGKVEEERRRLVTKIGNDADALLGMTIIIQVTTPAGMTCKTEDETEIMETTVDVEAVWKDCGEESREELMEHHVS